jgi:hypothetical protein
LERDFRTDGGDEMARADASPTCNIGQRGRRVRSLAGAAALAAALPLALAAAARGSPALGTAAGAFAAGGLLGIYQARRGRCMLRAAGIPTPF